MPSSTWWGGREEVKEPYIVVGMCIGVYQLWLCLEQSLGGSGGRVDNQSSRREVEYCFYSLDRLALMGVHNGLGFVGKKVWLGVVRL